MTWKEFKETIDQQILDLGYDPGTIKVMVIDAGEPPKVECYSNDDGSADLLVF